MIQIIEAGTSVDEPGIITGQEKLRQANMEKPICEGGIYICDVNLWINLRLEGFSWGTKLGDGRQCHW
jgi:hypothetical protein